MSKMKNQYHKEISEGIYKANKAKLFQHGVEVFGDKNKFEKWLRTPCTSLGGETPLMIITDSNIGIKQVDNILTEIDK